MSQTQTDSCQDEGDGRGGGGRGAGDPMAGNQRRNQCCGFGMFIPDPGRIMIFTQPGSRISDPGSQIQNQVEKRGVKKIYCQQSTGWVSFSRKNVHGIGK
jgi:hypothetical protein